MANCTPSSVETARSGANLAWFRPTIQIGFALGSILLGLEFRRFMLSVADPSAPAIAHRPPAVEAYLPISSLMSLVAMISLAALTLLSVVFTNFWCRYLCPYGALLGLFSALSPVAVRRDPEKCIGCGKCSKACPNRIPVDVQTRIGSAECTACFSCVQGCPAPDALRLALRTDGRAFSPALYGAVTLAAFIFVPQLARAAGYWHSDTPPAAYKHFYAMFDQIEHPRTGFAPPRGRAPMPVEEPQCPARPRPERAEDAPRWVVFRKWPPSESLDPDGRNQDNGVVAT